jgi:predicted Ser/Thr protein kinase
MKFSEFMEKLVADPRAYLHTSSSIISEAIKYFGYEIVVRSGEPTISYNIFKDLFSNGINAVFGQEFCIKQLVDVIEAIGKESGPNRGIVLVGPPASGKTNIVDLISLAVEEYSKETHVKLYSFYYQFADSKGKTLDIRSVFMHHPILLFPTVLRQGDKITRPRQELFEYINSQRANEEKIVFPAYYQNASLDKRNLDILESLLNNPKNRGMTLFEVIEKYVRVEKIEFSNPQAKGIANIDDMCHLSIGVRPIDLSDDYRSIVNEYIPGNSLYQYEGALVSANRGLLHIHDAFGNKADNAPSESVYKPLLMLLGSGKASIESTQTSVDTTVLLTTNMEEMELLEKQLTSSKLLDRIDKIPVNYLLDANSEMDILKRDITNMREKYDFDPNLLRLAAYYAVMTRFLPPLRKKFPEHWSEEKKKLYLSITPEQKLFIYATQPEDPITTIKNIPPWHPFRNEALQLGIDIYIQKTYEDRICVRQNGISLDQTGLFTPTQLKMIDDEFMRELINEHKFNEGKHGISVRQLQNIMRNTIARSDGQKVHIGIFFRELKKIFQEGPTIHHWLAIDKKYKENRKPTPERMIGSIVFKAGEGDYGDFEGIMSVAKALYWSIIKREVTIATVDRNPEEIEADLRRYIQHALLANAIDNRAFAHIMVPRYTFVDAQTGIKIDKPDLDYMISIENVLVGRNSHIDFRKEIVQRFLKYQASGEIKIEDGKSIVSSKNDNLINFFKQEYTLLLSHRRKIEGISTEQLKEAFFHLSNAPEKYKNYNKKTRRLVETILENMIKRFGYSHLLALDTIVYALRKEIIDFNEILK